LNRTEDEELQKVLGFVDEYLDATHDSRELSMRCRDYFDGYQWTYQEKEALRARKQPCITNNRIKPKVQFLLGMETQNRSDPKAYPRNPDDDESAEVSTDALRYVEDNNISEQKYSKGFKSYLIEGVQGHEVVVEFINGKFEIRHNVLNWDRLWYDPHSRENDFSDARYKGTLQWMDEAQAKEEFPKADESVFMTGSAAFATSTEETFEDRPSFFVDKKRKRVRVFFCYFILRGVWHYCIFTHAGFIQRPIPSPYLDDNKRPEPQFEFQSAFVDMDGARYGEVASYLDMQDEINKRRSKLLHLMSVRQTFSTKGATGEQSIQAIKNELAKPDGHIEFIDGKFGQDFGIIPTGDMSTGQALLLQEAKQEIDAVGANAALAGTEERQLSGRALQSLQQGGIVELGFLFDGNKYLQNRVRRMMFNRIKQFWTEERWIRVTDNEDKLRFTGINQRITLRDQIIDEFGAVPPQFEGDPRLNTVIGIARPANELDVDIVVDEMVDTVTLQQEQFEILAQMYQANPAAIPFELVIRASQLRNKDELLKMIQGGTDEEKAALAQAQQQEQQEQRELLKASAIAKIQKDTASAEKDLATIEKTQAETQQIVVDTAIDVEEAMEPRIQTFA
jgi:hypothetical protein